MNLHLCRVSEVYSSHASPDPAYVKTSDDVGDSSEDVQLEVFSQQVGRRVDDEHNVGVLTTLYWAWLCYKFDDMFINS